MNGILQQIRLELVKRTRGRLRPLPELPDVGAER